MNSESIFPVQFLFLDLINNQILKSILKIIYLKYFHNVNIKQFQNYGVKKCPYFEKRISSEIMEFALL